MIVDPFRGRDMDREDKRKVIEEVRRGCHALYFAHDILKDDKEVCIEAVRFRGLALEFASERMKNDQDVVVEAVKECGRSIKFANARMKDNMTVLKEGIKAKQWLLLEFVTEKMKEDDPEFHDILVEAVRSLGENLSFRCCKYLGDVYELVMGAVKEAGVNLEYASDRLKNDKDLALAAVTDGGCGFAIKFCGETVQDDKAVLMKYVSVRGVSLMHGSERLRNDKELVLKAVSVDGFSLQSASELLQDDDEIVHISVTSKGLTLQWASKRLQRDRNLVLEAVRSDGDSLEFASEELRSDREVVLESVRQSGRALKYANKKYLSDREMVTEMIKHDGTLLFSLLSTGNPLRDDPDLVILAMETMCKDDLKIIFQNEYYISRKSNRSFLLRALKSNSDVAHYVDGRLFDDMQFLKQSMGINALVSEKMITLAYKANWKTYKDEALMIACARYYDKAIKHCEYTMRTKQSFMTRFLSVNISGIHECLWYLDMEKDEKWIIKEAFHNQEKYKVTKRKDLNQRKKFLINSKKMGLIGTCIRLKKCKGRKRNNYSQVFIFKCFLV